jgi:CDP-diacylglycerol pyrophosphatase
VLVLALSACTALGPALPPPPLHPGGQALWRIIEDQCLPDQFSHGDPAPCAEVSLADGQARGYVVLKDRAGVAQHLLMPTAKITGIEDPALLAPGAVNYFARAWQARSFVEDRLGHPLNRSQISIAVNSIYGRSQDQLHLHIDCLDRGVGEVLQKADVRRGGGWADQTVALKGHSYRIRWLDAGALDGTDPFKLLARSLPGARQAMGAWTIALVGAVRADGVDGFYLLADRTDLDRGDPGSAEDLQDHNCRL